MLSMLMQTEDTDSAGDLHIENSTQRKVGSSSSWSKPISVGSVTPQQAVRNSSHTYQSRSNMLRPAKRRIRDEAVQHVNEEKASE